jgi:hypothetical protein
MYINFEYLNKQWEYYEFGYIDYLLLVAVAQKEVETFRYEDEVLGERLNFLVVKGYIEPLKSKSGYKVSSKGNNVLRDSQIAEITDRAKQVYISLIKTYEAFNREGKVGNKKRGLRYFANFMSETDFEHDDIILAVEEWLRETPEQFVNKLDLLVFKPQNVYTTKFKLEESKLYTLVNNYVHANS